MEQAKGHFEAILLFRDPRDIQLFGLAPQLADYANRHGMQRGAVQKTGNSGITFEADDVSLTLMVRDVPVSDPRFARAGRPAAEVFPREELAARVRTHRAAITLTAKASNSVAATGRAVQMLNEMALLLVGRMLVSVVYWERTDRIFAGEEYRASTGGNAPVRPARPKRRYLAKSGRRTTRPELPLLEQPAPVLPLAPYEQQAARLSEGRNAIAGENVTDRNRRDAMLDRAASAAAVAALATPVALAALLQTLSATIRLG